MSSGQLLTAKRAIEQHTETLRRTMDDLDELGGIMTDMLEQQEAVEVEIFICLSRYAVLRSNRPKAPNNSAFCTITWLQLRISTTVTRLTNTPSTFSCWSSRVVVGTAKTQSG